MLAFLVILALFVATVLLWLSMRRHLGRIDVEDEHEPDEGPEGDATPR